VSVRKGRIGRARKNGGGVDDVDALAWLSCQAAWQCIEGYGHNIERHEEAEGGRGERGRRRGSEGVALRVQHIIPVSRPLI